MGKRSMVRADRGDGGTIVEQGVARELLSAPQHERTQDFLRRVTHPI